LELAPRRRFARLKIAASPDAPQVSIDGVRDRIARRIDGAWFAVSLVALPTDPNAAVIDVVLGPLNLTQWRTRTTLLETYGRRDVFGAAKRALGKREIRRLRLWSVAEAFDRNANAR
jgi:hypothetical protein